MKMTMDQFVKKHPVIMELWQDEPLSEEQTKEYKEDLEFYQKFTLDMPHETMEFPSAARRPYYRLRGKKIAEDQAMEVLRLTDYFFRDLISDIRFSDKKCADGVDYSEEYAKMYQQFVGT